MIKPLYLICGLLDSGKTSLVKETLYNPNFNEGERTMILTFEMGEEEYDEKFLKYANAFVIELDNIKELTLAKMQELERTYEFDRIFIEANGTDDMLDYLSNHGLLNNWEIAQILSTFDTSMFRLQLTNLKQFIYNQIKISECCIFNRFSNKDDYMFIRNNAKAINPRVELIFEDTNREIVDFEDFEIFDLSQDVIEVKDTDYGLWYMDAANNPKKYEGKTVSLNVKLIEDIKEYENALIMGRRAMTCCEDDISNIGLTVVGVDKSLIKEDTYYKVTGNIRCIEDEEGYMTCLLYLEDMQEGNKPDVDLVYFS